eukprot:7891613-Lingulodinium_polyedra.AAC.1
MSRMASAIFCKETPAAVVERRLHVVARQATFDCAREEWISKRVWRGFFMFFLRATIVLLNN